MPVKGGIARNVAGSALTAISFMAGALIAVPVIIHHLGTAGYGVWSLAVTVLAFVTTAESGLGPAVQRFTAVAHGAQDPAAVRRLLWGTLVLYTAVGVLLAVVAQPLAPLFVDALDIPAALRDGAETMFRLMGPVVLLALLVAGLGNALQGVERFVSFGVTAAIGAAVNLGLTVVLLAGGSGLEGLALAAGAQQLTMLLGRSLVARDLVRGARPALLGRRELREVLGFSARLQVTVLSLLINSQTDKVIVGLIAPARTLGQMAIGAQVAEAARLVFGSALSPLVSRLSAVYGRGGEGVRHVFGGVNEVWMTVLVGASAVTAGAFLPAIEAWLGDDHREAAAYGVVLLGAYATSLVPGPGIAYLRAVGRPGVEARLGLLITVLNVVLTIIAGLLVGALGVVAATLVAYLVGSVWFLARLRREAPELPRRLGPRPRALALAPPAAALTLLAGLGAVALVPTSASLVPVGLAAGLVLLLYLSAAAGVPPSPRRLKAFVLAPGPELLRSRGNGDGA